MLTSPFPTLQITDNDASDLNALAHVFVQRTIAQYETFLGDDKGLVDSKRWKFVKERSSVRAFVQRREHECDDNVALFGSGEDALENPNIPICLVTGTIEGDLDDALYGIVCPTPESMRIKTSYTEDHLVKCFVLANLKKPTVTNPFETLSIKWCEKQRPLSTVFKNRDFVFMDATGTKRLRNGERIAYHLLQSVHFPATPEIDGVVRGNMSICGILRQKQNGVIDIYIRGYLNPAGGIERKVAVFSLCEALLASSQFVYCAEMRKLSWRMQQRQSIGCRSSSQSSSNGTDSIESMPPITEVCAVCSAKKRSVMIFRKRRSHKGACKVCYQYVCSSCKNERKMSFIAADGQLVRHTVRFCNHCVDDTRRMSAAEIAREEIAAANLYNWSEAYGSSSSTEQYPVHFDDFD